MEKKILGLDLGTNSIGWALVSIDETANMHKIEGMGSRIIPMSKDMLDDFSKGNPIETQTAKRREFRGKRRLRERYLLRRERLHRVLNVLKFLPEHYANQIDFEKRLGKFLEGKEPKIAYNGKEFLFKKSYEEMLNEFKQMQWFNSKSNGKEIKIPYDWTIYYLRKKALTEKIEKEELAWIILNFNKKRGYYQRNEEDTEDKSIEIICTLKIKNVEKKNKDKKSEKYLFEITTENDWICKVKSFSDLTIWKDTVKDFLVTKELNSDGSIKLSKEGNEKIKLSILPDFDEINKMNEKQKNKIYKKIKLKTEKEISASQKTVGTYIYETLLHNPSQKIIGNLVRTIDREFYVKELTAILNKQIELQPELFTEQLYNDCIDELYRNNENHRINIKKHNFVYLFVEDIIFYQRPLRSKKYLIGNCPMEYHTYKNGDTYINKYLKVVPKSNPFYQEFRVWQWLSNLKILLRENDTDVTSQFIKTNDDKAALFDFLMSQNEVNHMDVLRYLLTPIVQQQYPNFTKSKLDKVVKNEIVKYRWNYDFDDSKKEEEDKSKTFPCNETGYKIRKRLKQVIEDPDSFLKTIDTKEVKTNEGQTIVSLGTREYQLWHIIYSVTDKKEYESALRSFAKKYNLDENLFFNAFKNFPPFKSEYGAYSEKAIKKLLTLIRAGKYWSWDIIDDKTKNRIEKIISGEYDEKIKKRVREKAINLTKNTHFQGLPVWLASYIVYNRHSEAENIEKWNSVSDLDQYIKKFKQHSLRNPIVEQIVLETLRTVKDIWVHYGKAKENFFDEICIELGREIKNTAEERQNITSQINKNETTNNRIKWLLAELKESGYDNVRPESPIHQEKLKIYEDYVLSNPQNKDSKNNEYYFDIAQKSQPTKEELQKYKLWLEQKYRSPYTGKIIPLSQLFTEDYQIEHIIPKSRYFDDSFNNKVICESEINREKDKLLALEFIKKYQNKEFKCGKNNVSVRILSEDEYKMFVNENYPKNKKQKNLLLNEIPQKMIERQINDTRYISKYISLPLSNIVRSSENDDEINSKNLIQVNGTITTILKKDWGLNDVWNDLVLPRFERLNKLTGTTMFTYWNSKHQKYLPVVDYDCLNTHINIKRIDHRHHAMDALVIACTTRNHVNLLNNLYANSENLRYDLQNKLRNKIKQTWIDPKTNKQQEKYVFTEFKKPWPNFTVDAKNALQNIVVSFKQNLRIINKTINNYEKWIEQNGQKLKVKVKQEGIKWSIRKPLHKETFYGKVELNFVKSSDNKNFFASRKKIDTSLTLKNIESITDTGIKKILQNYLKENNNNPKIAFLPEGLEKMNNNIELYNDGKKHKPIYKVRIFEKAKKIPLGYNGVKKYQYVEAEKGTNLYFAIYQNEKGNREFETIPLRILIERLKQGLPSVPETNEKGEKLLFYLSPNDLVYVPTHDEIENNIPIDISLIKVDRIYRFVSSDNRAAFFVPMSSAEVIFDMDKKRQNELKISFPKIIQNEYGVGSPASKNENSIDEIPIQIKYHCIKLKVDRLGNISLV